MAIAAIDFGGGGVKIMVENPLHEMVPALDDRGQPVIPTAVFRSQESGEFLVGVEALQQGFVDSENLAFDFKRHLGVDDKLYFGKTASAEDVYVILLKQCVGFAERTAGEKITFWVATIPANSPDSAKRHLRKACERAGITLFPDSEVGTGMPSEPTAAAVAYGLSKNLADEKVLILIVDIGSTTTDCSLVEFCGREAQVLATEGIANLGGMDITRALQDLVLKKLKLPPAKSFDKWDGEARFEFFTRCDEGKLLLNSKRDVRIVAPVPGKPEKVQIFQNEFAATAYQPILQKVAAAMDKTINGVRGRKVSYNDIQYLVPVGGPCKAESIRLFLSEHTGIACKEHPDPGMAVVEGAARIAEALAAAKFGRRGKRVGFTRVRECIPHNIAIIAADIVNGAVVEWADVLIPKNLPAPDKKKTDYSTLYDHQTSIHFRFVQAPKDGAKPEECFVLGRITWHNLPLERVRTPRFEIIATFDSAAVVTIDVRDRVSGRSERVTLSTSAELKQNDTTGFGGESDAA